MLMDNQLKAFVLCVEHQTLNAYVWYTCLLLFIQVQKEKKIPQISRGVLPYQLNAQAINILSQCNNFMQLTAY